MVKEWAIAFGVLFAFTTLGRTLFFGKKWRSWIPGGIAVAVGESIPPAFFSYCSNADRDV